MDYNYHDSYSKFVSQRELLHLFIAGTTVLGFHCII